MFKLLNYPYVPSESVLAQVDQHVDGMQPSGEYYLRARGAFKRSDIRKGKIGEFATQAALQAMGISCSDPDLSILAVGRKSWDPDLVVTLRGQMLPLHVKTTGQMLDHDLSWTFNSRNLTGSGGRDNLFQGLQEDSEGLVKGTTQQSDLVTGVWVSRDGRRAQVLWFASWQYLLSVGLRLPVVEELRKSKKCIYMQDILTAQEVETDEESMLFRYPGGKKKILDKLLKCLGTMPIPYREPYFGGGSVGLAVLAYKQAQGGAWINDFDPGIAAVWETIRDRPAELQSLVGAFTPNVDDFKQYRSNLLANLDQSPVDRAFQKIAVHQMSFSGLGARAGSPIGGNNQPAGIKYDIACRWNAQNLIDRIGVIHRLLQGVRITHLDFEQVLQEPGKSFVYLDPPYMKVGADLYQYSHNLADHHRLARILKGSEHTWLLSYDDHHEVRALYDGCPIFEVPLTYTINGAARKHELLICSPDIEPRVQGVLNPGEVFHA